MKDLTSTSLGYLVAFLLPGFTGLYGFTFWSENARRVFQSFMTAQSTVGLFLLVTIAALALGIQITAISALVFQKWLLRKFALNASDSAGLADEGKLAAFRAAIDEHFRYHQFWAGMFLILPVLYCGWIKSTWYTISVWGIGLSACAFLGLEALNFREAKGSWRSFVGRAELILRSTHV